VTTLLLDTHVLQWWSAEPERVSKRAATALRQAEQLAVADITWYELAWLATHDRIAVTMPVGVWLDQLATHVHTVPVTPSIAATGALLPSSFPGDPADRLIYASAIDRGWRLVTKDQQLRDHPHPHKVTLW
jgi:PIN domain nuclease of toxin-antitoxin system